MIYDKISSLMDIEFSDWLLSEMNKRNWTQADLARASGLNRQSVSDYINRRRSNPEPNALDVCLQWDRRVQTLPREALWYSTLTSDGMKLKATSKAYEGRNNVIERDVRIICARAGVPYQSPHKLRHGHVVHALKQAHNMAELKAISQNIMHASVVITDQVYGKLVNNNVRDVISNLGVQKNNQAEILHLIEMLKAQLI